MLDISGHFVGQGTLVIVVVVDSDIQRIVLATEETTAANRARGHKEVLRSTGHIMVTTRYSNRDPNRDKSYATLQVMAPSNVKTVHQASLLHIESNLDRR